MNRTGKVPFPVIPGSPVIVVRMTLSALLTFIVPMTLTCSSMNDDILPTKLGSWTIATDTLYTPGNLYDYIDGGAELYLSYGFRNVRSRIYSAENQPDITVDIFDMNTSADAYGVFMNSAEGVSELVGQGTQYNEGFMLFWMDHYFVSILAYPETGESRDAVMTIARSIEKGIGKKGKLPGILEYLPGEGLDRQSIRYFHHYAWMNSLYYIAGENILLIDDKTGAVLARYGSGNKGSILLLIEYPSVENAGEAYESFISNYLPELGEKRSLKVEDGTYTGIERLEAFLILVFNAPGERETDRLTGLVRNRIQAEHQ